MELSIYYKVVSVKGIDVWKVIHTYIYSGWKTFDFPSIDFGIYSKDNGTLNRPLCMCFVYCVDVDSSALYGKAAAENKSQCNWSNECFYFSCYVSNIGRRGGKKLFALTRILLRRLFTSIRLILYESTVLIFFYSQSCPLIHASKRKSHARPTTTTVIVPNE